MSNRMASNSSSEILLIAESVDEQENVQQILAKEFGRILSAGSERNGLALFKKHHPILVILAFETVNKAEAFYLSLYREDKRIYSAPHKTLLLCRGAESRQAYDLCTAGILDDYVADRPMFDPWRLNLSVAQALKRFHNEQNSFWLSQHIETITTEMHRFNRFIHDNMTQGKQQQKLAAESFQQYTKKLSSDLQQLERNLLSATLNEDIFSDDSHEQVKQGFDQFQRDSIQAAGQSVLEQLEKSDDWRKNLEKGAREYRAKSAPDPTDSSLINILLVEDDDIYRETLSTMLKSKKVHVMAVSDGYAAINFLKVYQPDIVLLDYQMPYMNGVEAMKKIRATPKIRDIPVIMMSDHGSREVVEECMSSGANQFIVKPSDRKTILSRVSEVLHNQ